MRFWRKGCIFLVSIKELFYIKCLWCCVCLEGYFLFCTKVCVSQLRFYCKGSRVGSFQFLFIQSRCLVYFVVRSVLVWFLFILDEEVIFYNEYQVNWCQYEVSTVSVVFIVYKIDVIYRVFIYLQQEGVGGIELVIGFFI